MSNASDQGRKMIKYFQECELPTGKITIRGGVIFDCKKYVETNISRLKAQDVGSAVWNASYYHLYYLKVYIDGSSNK